MTTSPGWRETTGDVKIPNPRLLALFRGPGPCELCLRWCDREPHHHLRRGMGGCALDVPHNLIAVCRPCHRAVHGGRILDRQVLDVIARRVGRTAQDVEADLLRLRNLPKEGTP